MVRTFSKAVQNSLIFALDAGTRDIPHIDGEAKFWVSSSCIVVGCLPDSDGETKIVIGTVEHGTPPGSPLVDRLLSTPSRSVVFDLVHERGFHRMPVTEDKTRVRVWTDGGITPDTVTFVIGG